MKRVLGVLLGVAVACILPATAFGSPQYTAYVGCSPNESIAPSHVCQNGDEPGAFFESANAEVEYEVCIVVPGGKELCSEEEIAEEGVLYVNFLPVDAPGEYVVNWYVEGFEVAAWTFQMEPPAPPVVTPTPVVVPPAPVIAPPAGPTPACQHANHRVKQLKAQLKAAGTAKAKKGLRKRLRKAKAAAKAAC